MNRLKKIDSKWYYVVSEMFNKGSSYAIILFLSYFITDVQYGYITLFNSVLTLAVVFVSLNLTKSYITRVYFDKGANINEVIGTIVSFLAAFSLIAFAVGGLVLLTDTIYSIPTELICAGMVVAVFMSNYDIMQALMVVSEEKIQYCAVSILNSGGTALLTLVMFLAFPKLGIYAFIGAKSVVAIISCLGSFLYLTKKYKLQFKINRKVLFPALKYSLPLILHTVSGFMLNYFDRFMINDMIGIQDSAKYSFAHNLAMMLNIMVVAVNQGFLPKFYKLLEERRVETVNKIIGHNTFLLVSVAFVYSVFVDNIMFLMPAYYRDLQFLTFLLSFSYILFHGYIIYSNYLYYKKKTVNVFLNTLTAGIVNVILNYFFIQGFGYIGATVATLCSYVIMYISFYISARKMCSDDVYSFKKMTLSLLGAFGLIAGYYFARFNFTVKLFYTVAVLAGLVYIYLKKSGRVKRNG